LKQSARKRSQSSLKISSQRWERLHFDKHGNV
jgi:hypothetical protein